MNPGTVLAENVSRRFRVYPQRHVTLKEAIVRRRHLRPVDVWALKDVSFRIEPGESVGFMGRNGSGKTTLLRLIAGVFRPTSGRLAVTGKIGSLLELGAGFHQDFPGRDNIYLSASIYGLKKEEVDRRFDEIVEFSELERFIDLPIRTYSAGMHMRLGFSIAVNVNAEILLLDEVFAVGDEAFQRKCIDRILAFREQGKTIAFVSHSAAALERMCERALGDLGWDGAGRVEVRFEIERLPLAEGRFQFNLTLMDHTGGRRYHSMEKAVEFSVLPQGAARGVFLLEGDWSLAEAVSPRTRTAASRRS